MKTVELTDDEAEALKEATLEMLVTDCEHLDWAERNTDAAEPGRVDRLRIRARLLESLTRKLRMV